MTISITDIVTDAGDLPNDVLLGRLVLFTITDEPTPRDVLVQNFTDLSLNEEYLPADIRPLDAFKKATAEAKDKYVLASGATCEVLRREVEQTPAYVKQQITREVRDAKKQTLSYTKAIECTFYRGTARTVDGVRCIPKGSERVNVRVTKDGLTDDELTAVQDIARGIVERYKNYYDNLDGNRLRATVRNYLKGPLDAIEIKAGCYFVHAAKSDELARLATLVERLGGGCAMHTIPLVDLEAQRSMVVHAFARQSGAELQEVAQEARDLLAANPTPEAYGRIKARYDECMAKATQHMSTLGISQDITEAAERTALVALHALQVAM